jgi:hypothetical protein
MKILQLLSKPTALISGWTSAILCFSAASGYWLSGERVKCYFWIGLGMAEVLAIVW